MDKRAKTPPFPVFLYLGMPKKKKLLLEFEPNHFPEKSQLGIKRTQPDNFRQLNSVCLQFQLSNT